jgi:hypothetical protein
MLKGNDMPMEHRINLGQWGRQELEAMLEDAAAITGMGERIDFLSGRFLGVPYGESTLIGGPDEPEALVVNLQAVDCFTYLDYVEAMRMADSYTRFIDRLREVRYRGRNVAYTARRHFFTDWLETSRVEETTGLIAPDRVVTAEKALNKKDATSLYLAGIGVTERRVRYIPADALDQRILGALRTGDYVGIYAQSAGLDVTHVGIAVRRSGALLLRHASSAAGSVVEQDLASYVRQTPGVIILRPAAADAAQNAYSL